MRRSTSVRSRWKVATVAGALAVEGVLVAGGTTLYLGRTVVLAEEHGRADLVAVQSVRVTSARITPDGRHLVVTYIGGIEGCGQFSSLRVIRQREDVRVRVQTGNQPALGGCSLGGDPETRTVTLRQHISPATTVRQQL